jgi:hypothetical protein
MPRNSAAEQTRVRSRVEEYLREYGETPQPRQRLSAAHVARELHISRDTLRKYDLSALIREAGRDVSRSKPRRTVDQRLVDAMAEAALWKSRYEELARDHTVLVNYLKNSPSIDIDAVLSRSLPKAMRASPGGRRRFRR